MTKYSTADARVNFSDLINRAAYGKERIVLTRRGRDLAAVISIDDLEILEKLDDLVDIEAAKKAWAEQGEAAPEPWEAVKKKLGL